MPKIPSRNGANGSVGILAIDTEDTGLDLWHSAEPFIITCHWTEDADGSGGLHGKLWEWDVDPLTRKVQQQQEDIDEFLALVERAETVVFQNAKFDVTALKNSGIIDWEAAGFWKKTHDTLIQLHLVASDIKRDLTTACLVHLEEDIQPYEDRMEDAVKAAKKIVTKSYPSWVLAKKGLPGMPSAKEKTWKFDCWLPRALAKHKGYDECHPWQSITREYAAVDSASALALFVTLQRKIRDRGLEKIYNERRKLPRLAWLVENRGTVNNKKRTQQKMLALSRLSRDKGDECIQIAKELGHNLKMPKSGNSKSLTEFVFFHLKIPATKKSAKTGLPSLDKEVLQNYLASLPDGNALTFIKALMAKRLADTAMSYIQGYVRFWVPIPRVPHWFGLHGSLNPVGTNALRWSMSNPNLQNVCFDGETELLTTMGWVKAEQLTGDHCIAQYWPKTKRIDFVQPEVHCNQFNGDMVHIKTELYIDMMLTPEHRCLLRDKKTEKLRDVPAKSFRNYCKHVCAGWYGGGNLAFVQPEVVVWLCAVQADGSYHKSGGYDCGIRFIFAKERKIDRLRNCLDALSAKYTEATTSNGNTSFYVHADDDLVGLARELMPEKKFGPWLLEYDRETLDLFAEEVFLWDGCDPENGSTMYTSSDKENVDWVQIIHALSGHRTYTRTYTPDNAWAVRDHHYLGVSRDRDYFMTDNHTKTPVPWNGRNVYCVTVPSSYVVIRRNGKVAVTGNSKREAEELEALLGELPDINLRPLFGPLPGREWWSFDGENLERRIPAYEGGEKEVIALLEQPDKPPFFGSEHALVCSIIYPKQWAKAGNNAKAFKKTPEYKRGKAANLARQYGCSKTRFDITARVRGAFELVDSRFEGQKKLNQYWIDFANKHGYVETIPDRSVDPDRGYPVVCESNNGHIKPTLPLNYHVSPTAVQWINRAMVRVQEQLDSWREDEGFDGYIALQVHDELVLDFPAGDNVERARVVKRLMEQGGDDIGIPTPVSAERYRVDWGVGETVKL